MAQEAALAARKEVGELGALRQQLRELQQGGGSGSDRAAAAADPPALLGGGGKEAQRLLQEREELLASGAFSREDPVIQQLDQRIRECAGTAAAAGPADASSTGAGR